MRDDRKGTAFALGAAVCSAGFLLPYKAAAEGANRDAVVVALLVAAAILNSLLALRDRRSDPARVDRRTELGVAVVLSLFTALGNAASAEALARLDASVVSVLQQTQVFFVSLSGWVVLAERITFRFAIGALLAMGGFVFMHAPRNHVPAVDLAGTAWGLLSAFAFGLMIVITRRYIARIRPVTVNALRLWMSVLGLLVLPGRLDGLLGLEAREWALCILAAAIGPFLGRVAIMYAVRWVSASHATLLTLVSPIFAFLLELGFFGTAPSGLEVAGSAIILAGVALPVLEHGTGPKRG